MLLIKGSQSFAFVSSEFSGISSLGRETDLEEIDQMIDSILPRLFCPFEAIPLVLGLRDDDNERESSAT